MALQLGDVVPNFTADTTHGRIDLHDWAGENWVVLFSHPKDFTPVCTTELGEVARLHDAFAARGVKVIALSVDGVEDHHRWLGDIAETQGQTVTYPLIADPERVVAGLYGMIHPNASNTLTVRSVFVIDPARKLRLTLTYPASTGRDFTEILRVIDSLQLTDGFAVATPVNWRRGNDVIIVPAVTDAEAVARFPKGFRRLKPYLRITPQPDI
ncbi:peroxidase [Tistrella bauzanensis]|uniref:Thioredoxin peroxidase n=1 Tax=Tistrella bauzanensis TaxID=657419 RepID=A0ABQ1IE02_9PROT|nr:peroxiredoxin [Tistrella bauzanensis]GGB33653.1 peroxidase [Tistrella bauzanensis]